MFSSPPSPSRSPSPSPPRAFVTCAARSRQPLVPLIEAAEAALLDAGWRTRVPLRADADIALAQRRRVRRDSYDQAARARVVVHVPGPAAVQGAHLHRELNHAVKGRVPVLILVGRRFRDEHAIDMPSEERIHRLVELTGGTVIDELEDLAAAAGRLASQTIEHRP